MMDRGMVKWQPFNAVIDGTVMINDVLSKKNKVKMPVLCDEQRYEIQEKIFYYYRTQELVKIKYYKNGNIYVQEGQISFIDRNEHNIIINNKIKVFFVQIIAIF